MFTLSDSSESDFVIFATVTEGRSGITVGLLGINTNNEIFVEPLSVQNLIEATGLLKGNANGSISAAVAGTDYVTPDGMNTAIQTAIQNTWEASY